MKKLVNNTKISNIKLVNFCNKNTLKLVIYRLGLWKEAK